MNWQILSIISLLSLTAVSCGNKTNKPDDVNPDPSDTITKYDPVETLPPNTSYTPAFSGQTRTFGIKTRTALKTEVINSSLTSPWSVKPMPDGRFIITQKPGTMVILSASGSLEKEVTGFPAVNTGGQGGLLDVFVDPDFASNRTLYWSFSENYMGGTVTAVARGELSAAETSVENVEVIYRAEPSYDGTLHYGSRIIMDNSGHLIISTGERSDIETRAQAQDINSALGKIIRITTTGEPAADNPYLSVSGARPELYSIGHRNVQGLAYDAHNNIIYETEFGPRGGDEVNIIQPGKNYGWPVITYGIEYGGGTIGEGITQREGMEQPLYYWDPSVSPSGMLYYHDGNIEEWTGNLFIACLSGQHIVRLRLFDGKIAGEERLLTEEDERFRDIVIGTDGNLYAITDSGKLYKIAPEG